MEQLKVLEAADFNWVKHLDKVWSDDDPDAADIHGEVRKDFSGALNKLAAQKDSASPIGWVITGMGGSGKTHLLGNFRRTTLAKGGFFALVDMSGVTNFWATVLLHLVKSLHADGSDGRRQIMGLLDRIAKASHCALDVDGIPGMFRDDLAVVVKKFLNGLFRAFDTQTQEFQDVLRAVVMLASEDFDISNSGRRWLLGVEPDDETVKTFRFDSPVCDAKNAVAGISWLMSLDGGVFVLAFDQLDGIIKQYYNFDRDATGTEAATTRSIIISVCSGLRELRDITRRTLVVVSCLNDLWTRLRESELKTELARYEAPKRLSPLMTESHIEALVAARMAKAFVKENWKSPYPTWPFLPSFLGEMKLLSPREVLQRCDQHIKGCLMEGVVREAAKDDPEVVVGQMADEFQQQLQTIDEFYRKNYENADPSAFKGKEQEDSFWSQALACFARAFRIEQTPMRDADIHIDDDDRGDKKFPPLHVKLRLETMTSQTKDRHLGLRALFQPNAIAFQNKLKAAMTQSGIDRNLPFRKLVLIHFGSHPGGKVTEKLMEQFTDDGGIWKQPDDDVIRALAGLVAVEKKFPDNWHDWVTQKKPVQKSAFLQEELQWLMGDAPSPAASVPQDESIPVGESVFEVPAGEKESARSFADAKAKIPVGKRFTSALAGGQGEEIFLSLKTLKRHTAILGGSGSGKTVLTRRIVEEAALRGTPAIVIDIANDLVHLGQPWPETPSAWNAGDSDKAKRYFDQVEVKIWTPGKSAGNPLCLRQIPDLAAVAGDEDELMAAVDMTINALGNIMKISKNDTKKGIVSAALQWMARHGGGDIRKLADVLADLPEDSGAKFHAKADRMAQEMSAHLKGALLSNPLLGGKAEPTDVEQLLTGSDGRTRVSVVNLSGLSGIEAQQMFVNQLVMDLFGWIKKHPVDGLGGLLVIDEAKDFIPSVKSTPCKDSIVCFASQARKYGMGLLLATQAPKSVDTKIITNCNTQFFGRQNSPATIDAAEELLGRSGVGKLECGHFFLKSEELGADPVRMIAPLCLSWLPSSPLSGEEVVALARGER